MARAAFTIDQARELRDRYERGENTTDLAKEFKVGDGCIAEWIKKTGGTIRSNSESKRKFRFNEQFWDVIDNQIKAYWLGFFLADGYIGKCANRWRSFWCTLAGKDADHLKQFKNDISADYRVKQFERDDHQKAVICLTSVSFVDNLVKKGWLDFKREGNLRILDSVPSSLYSHFIRGFFDGDGSIVKHTRKGKRSPSYSIVIVAPPVHKQFLEWLKMRVCESTGAKEKTLKRGILTRSLDGLASVYRCHWNGNRQVARIGQWLYSDAERFLARKKARFDEISSVFVWPEDNRFSCTLKPSEIAALPQAEREKIVEDFYRLALKSQWKAPWYDDGQLLADLRATQIYDSKLYLVMDGDRLMGFRLNTGGALESPSKRIVLHFQPHFWDVKTSGPTVPSQWNNPLLVRRAAEALLLTGSKIGLMRYVRELRYAGAGVTSHFHASFACAIIQALAPGSKTWFDPCMGWGGRLIAAHVLGMDYEGCDPQPETFDGLQRIRAYLKSNANLHKEKAQDFKFAKKFDLGFTSPPFFNKEKYGGEEQSYHEFGRYDKWIAEFLCPLIDNMKANCSKTILHVDNRICDTLGKIYQFDRYPLFLQRSPGSPKGTESVLVFK